MSTSITITSKVDNLTIGRWYWPSKGYELLFSEATLLTLSAEDLALLRTAISEYKLTSSVPLETVLSGLGIQSTLPDSVARASVDDSVGREVRAVVDSDDNVQLVAVGFGPITLRSSEATVTVVDNLVTGGTTTPLSAEQGKVLQETKYTKPSTGIPEADLSSSVRVTLDKAKTALQAAPVTSVSGKTGDITLSKADVGLSDVENTRDSAKPVSVAQAAAIAQAKAEAISGAPVRSVASRTGDITLSKTDVGLGSVDNTSDANKPISTAQASALALKLDVSSKASDVQVDAGANDSAYMTPAKTERAISKRKAYKLYDSIAALRLVNDLGVTKASVYSYYAVSDSSPIGPVGGGDFVVNPTDTTTADNGGTVIVDAASRRWYRQYSGAVNTDWFGVVGDGATDDIGALQKASDWAIYFDRSGQIELGFGTSKGGNIKITKSWHLGYGVRYKGTEQSTAHVRGPGVGPDSFGVTLLPTFSKGAAIVMQGLWQPSLQGFKIKGQNYTHISSTVFAGNANGGAYPANLDVRDPAAWLAPTLDTYATSRFGPYAGIAIDPYCGAASTDPVNPSYPDVDYPAWLGSSIPQFNKYHTTFPTLSGLFIAGFVAGIVCTPNATNAMDDHVSIQRCQLRSNVYSFSTSHTDGRAMHASGCYMQEAYAHIVNNVHGNQVGQISATFTNCVFDRAIKILQVIQTGFTQGGNIQITGGSGESLWSIGEYGGGNTSESQLSFIGFQIKLSQQGINPHIGKPLAEFTLGDHARLRMDGVTIAAFEKFVRFAGVAARMRLRGMNLCFPYAWPTTTYERVAMMAHMGLIIVGRAAEFSGKLSSQRFKLDGTADTGGVVEVNNNVTDYPEGRSRPVPHHRDTVRLQGGAVVVNPNSVKTVAKNALTNYVWSNNVLTFDYTGRGDADFEMYGPAPGDTLVDTQGFTFVVKARNGISVTAELQNGYTLVNGVVTLNTTFITNSSTNYFYIFNNRVYALPSPLQCNSIEGAQVLAPACGYNGGTAVLSSLVVGDRLYSDYAIDNISSPSRNKISSIDTTSTGRVTLSGKAFITAKDRLLQFWVAPPLANS